MKQQIIDPATSLRRRGPLLNRRGLLTGAGALAALTIRPAGAVLRLDVTQGNV